VFVSKKGEERPEEKPKVEKGGGSIRRAEGDPLRLKVSRLMGNGTKEGYPEIRARAASKPRKRHGLVTETE